MIKPAILAKIQRRQVRCIENEAFEHNTAFYDPPNGVLYYAPGIDLGAVLFTFNLTPYDMRLLTAMKIDPR